MKTPHTGVWKGKRIKVVMKDGEVFIDRFLERKSRWVFFNNHKVERGKIKSFSIVK
jgi:hypothetical protein